MGCGANSKSAQSTSRPQLLPASLQPARDANPSVVSTEAALPPEVLAGFMKSMRIPARNPAYRKRRPNVTADNPFAGIIADPVVQDDTASLAKRHTKRNRDSGIGIEGETDLMQLTASLAAPYNTIIRQERGREEDCDAELRESDRSGPFQPSERQQDVTGMREETGKYPAYMPGEGTMSSPNKQGLPDTSLTGLLDSEQAPPYTEQSLDPVNPLPAAYLVPLSSPDMPLPQSISTLPEQASSFPTNRADLSAQSPPIAIVITGPTLLIPNGSESQLEHNSNPSPFNQDSVVPAPQTSQQLATERLARVYNSERGLSPMPSRPVDELSDDESFEITSVIDETCKAVRFAKEKASFEAASRLAAERNAEENQALSPQTAFSDGKKSAI